MTTQTLVDESQFDPVMLQHWRSCKCELCLEELADRGLPLEPAEPTTQDETPKPTQPAPQKMDPKKRARLVVRLRERGETVNDIAKDLGISKERVRQILKAAEKHKEVDQDA